METHERPYANTQDLLAIGRLVRRAYTLDPHCNAWSVARFDIWAQHRLADAGAFGKVEWQRDIRLWEDAGGALLGAAWLDRDREAALILDPAWRDLAEAMLAWVEAQTRAKGLTKPIAVEALEGNAGLVKVLESWGYVRSPDCMLHRKKLLAGTPPEPVALPAGYTMRPRRTREDLHKRMAADKAVFNYQGTVEDYDSLQQAPSYLPELDLIVLSEQGEVAAFCSLWLDRANGVAEFEPVGTRAEHRQRGLARALIAEACNRLRAMGVRYAAVDSWSESPAANGLYSAAGLEPWDRAYGWEKQGPTH